MTSTSQQVWLYIRGDESIRVIKFPIALVLRTFGPGHAAQTYSFQHEERLEDFRRSYDQQLLDDGWTVHAAHERRLETPSSGSRVERRRPGRSDEEF